MRSRLPAARTCVPAATAAHRACSTSTPPTWTRAGPGRPRACICTRPSPATISRLGLQQQLTDLPKFRRLGGETAYIEGWGLYAESLGRELGLYQDPYNYYGYLQNALWRAIRLVTDTGLHSKGWTRTQAIDYMLNNSAMTRTDAEAEVDRYMAIPGQALAYKVGEMKIAQLREQAQRELGPRFDVRAFHTEVLKDGSVPLDILQDKIQRWIATQKG